MVGNSCMTQPTTKQELETRLIRYRDLARRFLDPVSVTDLRQGTAELERQIRETEE